MNHFHITLRWVDDYLKLSEDDVARAGAACESAAASAAPFEVRLNHVISWGHALERNPLVMLGGPDDNDSLLEFHQILLRELVKNRCPGRGSRTLTPQITLLYDKKKIPEEPVPAVNWIAGEVILIHSEPGSTIYHEKGLWKLRG